MNRRRADALVGFVLVAALVIGGVLSWQAYQRRREFDQMMESMMGSSGMIHGTNPLWYVLGTVLLVAAVGGAYLVVREDLTTTGASATPSNASESSESSVEKGEDVDPETQSRRRALDLLPDDERRILEPVIESPGITQIELRDRSDFSKSKVSQTVSELEKRGLLYRERQGRTYRVYPSDEMRPQ